MTSEPTLVSGAGELGRLGVHLDPLGVKRALILCGPNRRFVAEATEALGTRTVEVFDGAEVHVPRAVVDRATEALQRVDADVVIALGGGAAIGLGKALRLTHDVAFVAVPTTYAGSEATTIWGITQGKTKVTGRDDRARPDLVIADPRLSAAMPLALTVQSLLNALAHPISSLSRAAAASDNWEPALSAVRRLVSALNTLLTKPGHMAARSLALEGAAAAGRVLDAGDLGTHHRVAHALGGRFGTAHAALHSVLLPAFLADLRQQKPDRYAAIAKACGEPDLIAVLHDALLRVGAPTGLRHLELLWEPIVETLRAHDVDELEFDWVNDAFLGRRCSVFTRRESWVDGAPKATLAGPPLPEASRVVVALHGRGSTADAIVRRVREIVGDAPDVAIVAPQAAASRWYSTSYREAAGTAELGAALQSTAAVIAKVRARVADERIVLFGFSQGACLALEAAARLEAPVGGVIALSGARVGPADWVDATQHLSGVPMLLGLASQDPWASTDDVVRTADHFTGLGANVCDLGTSGDAHEITARQRLATRELICGEAPARFGYGNVFDVETLPGALPREQNSPRRSPYGLSPEQINGSGFVAPRETNLRSWLYRVRPAAGQRRFVPLPHPTVSRSFVGRAPDPKP